MDLVHLTAAEAGATARDGQAGRLLLTYLAGADVACVTAAAAGANDTAVGGAVPGLVVRAP